MSQLGLTNLRIRCPGPTAQGHRYARGPSHPWLEKHAGGGEAAARQLEGCGRDWGLRIRLLLLRSDETMMRASAHTLPPPPPSHAHNGGTPTWDGYGG